MDLKVIECIIRTTWFLFMKKNPKKIELDFQPKMARSCRLACLKIEGNNLLK